MVHDGILKSLETEVRVLAAARQVVTTSFCSKILQLQVAKLVFVTVVRSFLLS